MQAGRGSEQSATEHKEKDTEKKQDYPRYPEQDKNENMGRDIDQSSRGEWSTLMFHAVVLPPVRPKPSSRNNKLYMPIVEPTTPVSPIQQ